MSAEFGYYPIPPYMEVSALPAIALLSLLAMLLVLLAGSYFRAGMVRYLAHATRFEGEDDTGRIDVVFQVAVTGGSLFKLQLGNFCIRVLSLGLLTPWARLRSARYFTSRLHVSPVSGFVGVAQSSLSAPTRGEGLAEITGIEIGL